MIIEQGTKIRVKVEKTNFKGNVLKAFAKLSGDQINDICGVVNDELKL